jgi:predicted RNase H-like HicB family nuclease
MKKEKVNGLTVICRKVREGYIAYAEEVGGINTQGSNLKAVKENIRDAIKLVLEVNSKMKISQTTN